MIIYRVVILHIDYTYGYDYEFDFEDHGFKNISQIEENHPELLQHPVNESFMLQIWMEITRRLRINFAIYSFFVICLTSMVHTSYWQFLPNSKTFCSQLFRSFPFPVIFPGEKESWRFINSSVNNK